MRSAIALSAIFVTVFVFAGEAALAQTTQPAKLSNRALFRRDSNECAKQVDHHRLDLFGDCMTKRQDQRKAAAKQKTDECKAKAAEQKLHYVKRLRFIRKCSAAG
jgi:hypothetical protein